MLSRYSSALLTVAMVLTTALGCSTPTKALPPAAPVQAPVPADKSPEEVAAVFFEALIASDLQGVMENVSFPLMWDARCRILADSQALEKLLVDSPIPEDQDFQARIVRRVEPKNSAVEGESEELQSVVKSSLEKFSSDERCDDPISATAPSDIVKASKEGEFVYLLTYIVIDGATEVPTLLRLKKTGSGWRVTGLDN